MIDFTTTKITEKGLIIINKLKNIVIAIMIVVFLGLIVHYIFKTKEEQAQINAINDDIRMHAICPSLLSIARSARDTLIIMKAEPLCNNYVLLTLE